MKKIGLVLSGGGVRGIAHLGILKFLEECGCVINCISGTSTGAMLGAFNAFGYSALEILTITKNTKLFSLSDVAFSQSGIFNMKGIEESIIKHIPENTFECLRFPLHATATNILTGEAVYFSTGILSSQLMASSCVPFIFKPIEYQGHLLVDGGIVNNCPVEPLIGKCDVLIGVHVNSMSKKTEHLHIRDILDRSFHFALSHSVYSKVGQLDLFLEPPDMSRFSMFDMTAADEIFSCGYDYAKTRKQEIINTIQ